jgi:heat-inducible transcriptional repressor
MLDQRTAYILTTVVYEYIATAEPVGSQTLTQKYDLGVSSATVRNEMAELEAGGYLVQPHASAGRTPTDAGYRTYVDELMAPETLPGEEEGRIREGFRAASRELDEVIDSTTRLLGQLSNNLAFVVAPSGEKQTFRHIQLIWLSPQTGIAIVVASTGVAAQHAFDFKSEVEPDELTRLSNRLNAALGGKTLREIALLDVPAIARAQRVAEEVVVAVSEAFAAAAASSENPVVSSAGARNLLDQPEFRDVSKLRSILRVVEEQKKLYDLVADAMHAQGPLVKIGQELCSDDITECSLVTVPYRFEEGMVGVLAILGPRRMPYGRLLALASLTAQSLNAHFTNTQIR